MSNLLLEKNELQILGKLLRKERESGCYTGQEIAQKIGLSKQMISDIETGNKNVSMEKVKIYADFFDINIENYKRDTFKAIFWENLRLLIYANFNSFTVSVKKILEKEIYYTNSCDAPSFYLLQMIYFIVMKNNDRVNEIIQIIDEYFIDLFDSEELFIYYIYLGNNCAEKKEWNKALYYYAKAGKKCSGVQEDSQAMLYYGLGFVYWKLENPINSLSNLRKAKYLFDSTNNYIRSLYTECHIGMNFTHLYRFDDAEKMYKEILKVSQLLHDKKAFNAIRLNLAENYFYKGDYEQALLISQESLNEGIHRMQMNDIQMWSYYKLGKMQECSYALQKLKEAYDGSDEYYHLMIGTMQAILENDNNEIIQYLKLLYTFTENDNFFIVQDFILDLLIENLSRQKRYREAMDYSRIQLNLLRKKMSEPRKD